MKDISVTVLSNHRVAEGIYKLTARLPENFHEDCKPGQFAQIAVPGASGHILRRPICIHSFGELSRTVSFVYQVKGSGTDWLSRCRQEDELPVLLPLGNGFTLPENAQKVLIVGGGIGAAPFKFAADSFRDRKITMVLGFQSRDKAYLLPKYQECCSKLVLCTDDGSLGRKGYVGEAVREEAAAERPDVILACGPEIVLRQVKDLAEELQIPCQLSLEARMGCGFGVCVTCNVKIGTKQQWHYQRCCTDGPVFDAKEVVFDD